MTKRFYGRAIGRCDPRYYQIAALALLLLYGLVRLRLDVQPGRAVAILLMVLLVQLCCTRLCKLPAFDPRSALISGLSLCLLLRTNSLVVAALTAAVAIAGKFALRWRGKHVFNPTNFGLVFMMLVSGGTVWVSPGQWGDFAFFASLVVWLARLVVNRASRADLTLAFIGASLAALFE